MFKRAFLFILIFYTVLDAYQAPKEMKYFINVNDNFKGVLLFQNENGNNLVKYFNITSRDRIPFYAKSEEFKLTTLGTMPTLKSLKIESKDKHIVYNLSSLSSDAIEEADISQMDIPKSAIIYDKDDLPSDVIEKRLIHTVESLILSIFETKKIPTKAFYIYEPHKNMLVKVKFFKESKENVAFANDYCHVTTYVLKIVNRNKRLIRVYTNGSPIKVESYSKKWSFVLAGVGKPHTIKISNKEIAFKVFRDEVFKNYEGYNVKIVKQFVKNDMYDEKYITTFQVFKKLNKSDINKAIKNYVSNNNDLKYVKNKKDAFVLSVSNKDVMNLFKSTYDLQGKHYFWKKGRFSLDINDLLTLVRRQKKCETVDFFDSEIQCNGEGIDIDYENILNHYYKSKYKNFKISDIKELKDSMDELNSIEFNLALLHKIDDATLSKVALKALKQKYPNYMLSSNINIVKHKNRWVVYVSKQAVLDTACSKIIPNVVAKYKNGECEGDSKLIKTEDDINEITSKFLDKNYKDVKILGTKIHKDRDGISFSYLNNLTEVKNACK